MERAFFVLIEGDSDMVASLLWTSRFCKFKKIIRQTAVYLRLSKIDCREDIRLILDVYVDENTYRKIKCLTLKVFKPLNTMLSINNSRNLNIKNLVFGFFSIDKISQLQNIAISKILCTLAVDCKNN